MSASEKLWYLIIYGVALTTFFGVMRYFGDDDLFGRLKRKRERERRHNQPVAGADDK